MRFEELPDFPKRWIDFVNGMDPEISALRPPFNRQYLHSQRDRVNARAFPKDKFVRLLLDEASGYSERALKNIQRLQRDKSVAVIANINADIFGGTLSQLLKCMNAAKVCGDLVEHGIDAVPVCWIGLPINENKAGKQVIRMMDAVSVLQRFQERTDENSPPDRDSAHCFSKIPELIAAIERIGQGLFNPEVLDLLKGSYRPGVSRSSAAARLLADLMNGWGLVVIDSRSADFQIALEEECISLLSSSGEGGFSAQGKVNEGFFRKPEAVYFMQCSIFPVFACLLGPQELRSFAEARAILTDCAIVPPAPIPASSATIIDARSRRILEKYQLRLPDLYADKADILERLMEGLPGSSTSDKLDSLISEVDACLDELNSPAPEDAAFRKVKQSCRNRILFQLNKIKSRCEKAGIQKRQIMQRHIYRVCDSLAPDGARQEDGITGIYFLLRYSRTLLTFLYERLDLRKNEHQCIEI